MTVPLHFNDLLASAGYDPAQVVVLRHRPWEAMLRRAFSWLAAERPDLYDAFQGSHGPIVEKALSKAKYLASFIGSQPGRAPENQQLRELGMAGPSGDRPTILRFDLPVNDFCVEWRGRLVCEWPGGERSWWRWADRNTLSVHAINEESRLVCEMPGWHTMSLT